MPSPLDDFSGAPLTEVENRKARKIIQDQERMDWLWASARIWIGWGAASIATIYAAKEYIIKAIRALMS